MKRLVLALGVALGLFAMSGTASAQFYRSSSWQGGHYHGGGGHWHGGGGHYHYYQPRVIQHYDHFHYVPGHYHYHQPRVIYSTPQYFTPYSSPSYGYPGYYGGSAINFGYSRPGLSLGLSFIR